MTELFRRLLAALSLVLTALSAGGAEPATDRYGDSLPPGAVARLGTYRLRHLAHTIVFATDGKTFATGGDDALIRLWNVADGKEIRVFKGPTSRIVFSADGKKLYSSGDNILREWDVADGKELRTFTDNVLRHLPVIGMTVHPTEPRLLTTENGCVREWDLKEGKLIRSVAVPHDVSGHGYHALCPDGQHFAVFKDNTLTLRDLTDKEVRRFPLGNRREVRLTFSADGSTLAATCSDRAVVFWDVKTGRELRTLIDVDRVTLSTNGRYFAVRNTTRSVCVRDVASGRELCQIDVPNIFDGLLAFSRDDKRLAICQRNVMMLWDLEKSRPALDFPGHAANVYVVHFSSDGKRLTSVGNEGTAIWWDIVTARPVATWPVPSLGRFSPDGRSFYVATDNGLSRYDLMDGKPVEQPILRERNVSTSCLAVSPNGKLLAVLGRDKLIHFYSADAAKDLGHLTAAESLYSRFLFSQDGKQLAGASNGLIRLWDVPSGTVARQFDLAGEAPILGAIFASGMTYSPDGKSLLTATYRGVILWEAASGRERWRVLQQAGELNTTVFSPDGRLAAVGSGTGSVYVLDTATGAQLAELAGHRAEIRGALDFSPDSLRLASGSYDGTVVVWDMAELIKKARPTAAKLTDEQLAELWRDLGGLDSAKAHKAVRALAASPQGAGYIQANIKGGEKFNEVRAKKLLAQLDDEEFEARENAEKELASMRGAVIPLLRAALKDPPSVEVKKRIERLLEPFKDQPISTDQLRGLRAVEALELASTADALTLKTLKTLSGGDTKDPLAQDAKGALERLAQRDTKP